MSDFCCVILALVSFGMGCLLGAILSDAAIDRLKQENQSLRRMLDDMHRMDELVFKTYYAMIKEAVCSHPQTRTKPLPPKK